MCCRVPSLSSEAPEVEGLCRNCLLNSTWRVEEIYFKGNWRHLRIGGPPEERDSQSLFHVTSIRLNMIVKTELYVDQSLSALNSHDFIGFHCPPTVLMQCPCTPTPSDKLATILPVGLRQQAVLEVFNNVDTTHVSYAPTSPWSACAASGVPGTSRIQRRSMF